MHVRNAIYYKLSLTLTHPVQGPFVGASWFLMSKSSSNIPTLMISVGVLIFSKNAQINPSSFPSLLPKLNRNRPLKMATACGIADKFVKLDPWLPNSFPY